MRWSRRRQRREEIPASSLADIAFLLLIFFIATTTFAVEFGLPLVLPSAQRSAVLSVRPEDVFQIEIHADGRLLANGSPIDVTDIASRIRALNGTRQTGGREEMVVIVETEARAAYEQMIAVLDQVRESGARRVALKQLEAGSP
jgi:biopolymer transport protein ExbD